MHAMSETACAQTNSHSAQYSELVSRHRNSNLGERFVIVARNLQNRSGYRHVLFADGGGQLGDRAKNNTEDPLPDVRALVGA